MSKEEEIVQVAITITHVTNVVVRKGEEVDERAVVESIMNDIDAGHGGISSWLNDSIDKTEILKREPA